MLTRAFKITIKSDVEYLGRFWFYTGLLSESSTVSSDSCINNYEVAIKLAKQAINTKIIIQPIGSVENIAIQKKSDKTRQYFIAKAL